MLPALLKVSFQWLWQRFQDPFASAGGLVPRMVRCDPQNARAGRGHRMAYHRWHAWYPVWPEDDFGVFWLEPVWVRYDPVRNRWSYRSLRTEIQKREELERVYPF
jgi:hypothetical protein